jgi:hypothetical protein
MYHLHADEADGDGHGYDGLLLTQKKAILIRWTSIQ